MTFEDFERDYGHFKKLIDRKDLITTLDNVYSYLFENNSTNNINFVGYDEKGNRLYSIKSKNIIRNEEEIIGIIEGFIINEIRGIEEED